MWTLSIRPSNDGTADSGTRHGDCFRLRRLYFHGSPGAAQLRCFNGDRKPLRRRLTACRQRKWITGSIPSPRRVRILLQEGDSNPRNALQICRQFRLHRLAHPLISSNILSMPSFSVGEGPYIQFIFITKQQIDEVPPRSKIQIGYFILLLKSNISSHHTMIS